MQGETSGRNESELVVAFRIDDPPTVREVSYETNGSELLRGSVQKEAEDTGGD